MRIITAIAAITIIGVLSAQNDDNCLTNKKPDVSKSHWVRSEIGPDNRKIVKNSVGKKYTNSNNDTTHAESGEKLKEHLEQKQKQSITNDNNPMNIFIQMLDAPNGIRYPEPQKIDYDKLHQLDSERIKTKETKITNNESK